VDVVWALSRASVYLELIEHRGWSADRYEQWLGDTLFQQLLGDTSVTPAASRGD
jgi:hypothetical protein